MDKRRRLTSADVVPSKKGPHGGRLCRWCNEEVFPPRKTYCSDHCVYEWKLRSDVQYLRSQVFMRDKGFCAACGLDTLKLRRKLYDLSEEDRVREAGLLGFSEYHAKNLQLWEADHTVPVSQGGGLVGLGGFQTLCVPCHHKKTREDTRGA